MSNIINTYITKIALYLNYYENYLGKCRIKKNKTFYYVLNDTTFIFLHKNTKINPISFKNENRSFINH